MPLAFFLGRPIHEQLAHVLAVRANISLVNSSRILSSKITYFTGGQISSIWTEAHTCDSFLAAVDNVTLLIFLRIIQHNSAAKKID